MAITDRGYASKVVAQRLHNLLSGSGRLAAALAVVDTEFNATWPTLVLTTPAPAVISLFEVDRAIGWGQAQVFCSTSRRREKDKRFSEQPIAIITGEITVALQARHVETADEYLRRYECAIFRLLLGNRGLNPDNDGLHTVVGIGMPESRMARDHTNSRGLLYVEIPDIMVQEYGN